MLQRSLVEVNCVFGEVLPSWHQHHRAILVILHQRVVMKRSKDVGLRFFMIKIFNLINGLSLSWQRVVILLLSFFELRNVQMSFWKLVNLYIPWLSLNRMRNRNKWDRLINPLWSFLIVLNHRGFIHSSCQTCWFIWESVRIFQRHFFPRHAS